MRLPDSERKLHRQSPAKEVLAREQIQSGPEVFLAEQKELLKPEVLKLIKDKVVYPNLEHSILLLFPEEAKRVKSKEIESVTKSFPDMVVVHVWWPKLTPDQRVELKRTFEEMYLRQFEKAIQASDFSTAISFACSELLQNPKEQDQLRIRFGQRINAEEYLRYLSQRSPFLSSLVEGLVMFPGLRPQIQALVQQKWGEILRAWNQTELNTKVGMLADLEFIFAERVDITPNSELIITPRKVKIEQPRNLPDRNLV